MRNRKQSILKKIWSQNIVKQFFPIICQKNFHFCMKLILNHCIEWFENCDSFKFHFEKVHPSYVGAIINEAYKPSKTIRSNMRWSQHITINDRKQDFKFFILHRKWNTMTLVQLTNFTLEFGRASNMRWSPHITMNDRKQDFRFFISNGTQWLSDNSQISHWNLEGFRTDKTSRYKSLRETKFECPSQYCSSKKLFFSLTCLSDMKLALLWLQDVGNTTLLSLQHYQSSPL